MSEFTGYIPSEEAKQESFVGVERVSAQESLAELAKYIEEHPKQEALVKAAVETILRRLNGEKQIPEQTSETIAASLLDSEQETPVSGDEDIPPMPGMPAEELPIGMSIDDNGEIIREQQNQTENISPEEQLKRKVNEAVVIGQSFIDQLTNLFDLSEITDGSVITVNQDGIKDSINSFISKMDHMRVNSEIDKIRESISWFKKYLETNQKGSISVGLEQFIENMRFFLFQLAVENQKMSYWKPEGNNSDKGWITTTETAGKIYDKLRAKASEIILNQENIDQFLNLFDQWSRLNNIMTELNQLDNQTGRKIANRTNAEIYKPLPK